MSKRQRRSRTQAPARQERLVGPLLIVVGVLILGAVLLVAFLSNRSSEAASTTGSPEQGSGTPRLTVAQDTIDLGSLRFETPAQSVFSVRNTGDRDLAILGEPQVELVEGC